MALLTQLVASVFLSYLRGEWFYWLMAMCLGYARVTGDALVLLDDCLDHQGEEDLTDGDP